MINARRAEAKWRSATRVFSILELFEGAGKGRRGQRGKGTGERGRAHPDGALLQVRRLVLDAVLVVERLHEADLLQDVGPFLRNRTAYSTE